MKFKNIKRPKIRIRRPRVRIRWRKKNSKWVIGIVMLFFLSLFAFQLVLMNYAKSILQNILNFQLEQVTGGTHISSFEGIEISYTNKSLIIKNIMLVPKENENDDNNLDLPATPGLNSYKVFIPAVKIVDINLRKAYFQNYLEIGQLVFLQPQISLSADFDTGKEESDFIFEKDLYKILPAGIKEFKIRTVTIEDGNISIRALKNKEESFVQVSPLQLEFNNFHLDKNGHSKMSKLFYSDNFFLEADSIGGYLADKKYNLSIGSVKLSSADSSAFASNFKLQPVQEIETLANNSTLTNIYNLGFAQVYLYGLSYNEFYQSNDLIASEVTILDPGMELVNLQPLKPGQKENFRLENLYPAIDKILNSIQVKNLFLRNGQVKILDYHNGLQNKMVSDINAVEVKNFILDSLANQNDHKLLYSDQISFKLNNYSLKLSDNIHLLQAEELFFSSEQSEIVATEFKVSPDSTSQEFGNSGQTYFASAPSIHLQGVDMLNAYNNNILNIDSLGLSQPSFTLNRIDKPAAPSPSPPTTESGFHEEDLYALIEDYLYSLNVNKIALQKGLININSVKRPSAGAFITNIRKASFWNFRLDSASAYQMNKLFYANDFELEIEKYDHLLPDDLHRITADEIGISTLQDKIQITDLKIFAGENQYPYPELETTQAKTLLNLHVPLLELDKVDILKAYLYKRLEVGQVRIPSPSIQLGTLLGTQSERTDLIKSSAIYDLIKDYLEVIKVEELLLEDGALALAFYADKEPLFISGSQTEIKVNNFRFDSLTSSDPKRLFFADNVRVKVADFSTHLPDGIHEISARNFLASTELQEIVAEEVKVSSGKSFYTEEELLEIYGQKGYFNLLLPKARFTGIDFDKAYYNEHLKIDSVVAEKPEVHYTYLLTESLKSGKEKKILQKKSFYEALAPFFEVLEINSLSMEDGWFNAVQQEDGQQMESTLLEGIYLQMDNYLVDSTSTSNTERFLFADDIRINIEKYQQELLDKVHTLSARNLVLSTALQQVKAEDIWLKPDSKKMMDFQNMISSSFKSRYNIRLPHLEINGIGFDEVYNYGTLEINELLLLEPDISIRHHPKQQLEQKKQRKNGVANYDLYELIKGNLKSLRIQDARISNGKGDYTRISGLSTPFHLDADKFDAQVINFIVAENHDNQDKLLNADDVRLSIKGFERKLSDSLHIFKLEELKVSTQENEIELIGAELLPREDLELVQKLKEKGVDKLFHITMPYGLVSGIDTKLIQKDSINLDNLLLKDAMVHIYSYPHLSGNKLHKPEAEREGVQQFLNNINLIRASSITVKNGGIKLTTIRESMDSTSFYLDKIDGLASNFIMDSLAGKDKKRLFYSDWLQIKVSDYTSLVDNDLYMFKIKSLHLDSRTSDLIADSLSLTPVVDRKTYASIKGYESDQFTIRNRKITLKNISFDSLLAGNLMADSLLLDGLSLHIYRDKSPPSKQDHFPKMPQQMIRDLDFGVMILGTAIRNVYIGYEEQVKGAPGTGFIDLTKLNIFSDTITNNKGLLANGLTTDISLDGYLMGKGHLEAYFEIPLGDTLNRHIYHGQLDAMELSEFNPILEKTVFIKIRDGQAQHINFYVESDINSAKGSMDFFYQNLNVALVNKRTGKTGGPVKEVGSLIANWLVVNTNNTTEGEKPFKKGEISFERDENRSTVNYWVKALVNGFKSSIGL